MELVTLNGKNLKDLAHKSHTAERTMTSLAIRERVRTFSDIPRTRAKLIKEGEKIVEEDYNQFWKDLQAAGVGTIVNGRRGVPSRFEWHFSLKQVAKAALEGIDQKATPVANPNVPKRKVIRRPRLVAAPKTEAPKAATKVDSSHFIYLRNEMGMEVKLPSDVSADQLQRVAKALQGASA